MRVLIAAGGTAGHINPALAIAGAIKAHRPDADIHFAGRRGGMEYGLVTRAGYPFHHIEVNGIQRSLTPKNIARNVQAVYHLALSGPRAKKMLRQLKPDLVIGCGGYVSGPVVRCAAKMGIRTAIHEQNAFPGVTNKLLAKDVDVIFAAVPAAVDKLGAPEKTSVVGNPVRPEIFMQNRALARQKLAAGQRTVILSFGGSLGARRINEVIADLAAWEQTCPWNILHIHATGSRGVKLFAGLLREKGVEPGERLVVREYIENMPELLAAADLVIGHQPGRRADAGGAGGGGPCGHPHPQPQRGGEPPVLQRPGAAKGRGGGGPGGKGSHRPGAGANGAAAAAGKRQAGGDGQDGPRPGRAGEPGEDLGKAGGPDGPVTGRPRQERRRQRP